VHERDEGKGGELGGGERQRANVRMSEKSERERERDENRMG